MEPITGVERISKQRWKLVCELFHSYYRFLRTNVKKCSVCDIREGACIQCSKNSCFLAYHVTCARKLKRDARELRRLAGKLDRAVYKLTRE